MKLWLIQSINPATVGHPISHNVVVARLFFSNLLYGLLIVTLTSSATGSISIPEISNQQDLTVLVNNNAHVVVEFYSPTCPVCMAFKRKGIFQETAELMPDVRFALVSSHGPLHAQYHIKATPTFVFFKNGHEVNRLEGYTDNPVFTHKVQALLNLTN